MNSYDVIIRPLFTEKTYKLAEAGKYTFEVNKNATKTDIKLAVEDLFKVEVVSVNVINGMKKDKRVGKFYGKTPAVYKAIVTLKKGQKIDNYTK